MRIRPLLLSAAVLLSGCTFPTGPTSGTLYRDVFWRSVAIDGVFTYDWPYSIELGSYTRDSGPGVTETCLVNWFLRTGSFGWVELAESGHVVRATPVVTTGPYDLFGMGVFSHCGGADEPAWSFDGSVVEAITIKSQGLLDIGSIGPSTMLLNGSMIDTGEAERWLEVHLDDMPLADTMYLPVDISVRAWQSDGTTLIGEWQKTVVLTYVREEAVYPRPEP